MEKTVISHSAILNIVPFLVDFAVERFWVDYDSDADVLYIAFQRPQKATDSRMTDGGILLRYRQNHLVGITVPDASTHTLNHPKRKRKK